MELYTLLPVLLFAGLSLYALTQVYRVVRDVLTSSWVRCTGKIETYDVKEREVHSTYSLGSYTVIVLNRFKYRYSVQGRNYEGVRVSWAFPRSMLRELVKSSYDEIFRNAPDITIFYNPGNPSQAVVLRGLRAYHLMNLLPALFLVIFVIWFRYSIP